MPAKVVDASAVAALLFGEPEAETVAGLMTGDLYAPALLPFELANIYVKKSRRHPERQQALAKAYQLRHRLKIETTAVDHDGVVALAQSSGLTAYDASYLWLARQIDADLVTLDQQLAAAHSAPVRR